MKRIAVAIAAAVIASAAAAQSGWQHMGVQHLIFDIPGNPAYSTQAQPMRNGGTANFHQYMFDEGKGKRIFIVQTTFYPPNLDLSNFKAALQAGADAAEKRFDGGKWKTFAFTTMNGVPGTDGTGISADKKLEVRMVSLLKGNQNVVLLYGGPPGSTGSADAQRFIQSLKWE
jgi:hypothetical protein